MAIFSCEFLLKFWCIFSISIEILLNSVCIFVLQFVCISEKFLWISYEFLFHFLWISYEILMQFLKLYTFGQKCMKFWKKCMTFLKLHKNCIRNA
jgi:hypothetical protein